MPEIKDIFQCTRCGYCCHGETTVSLSEDDCRRMVVELGGDSEAVREKYWRVSLDAGGGEVVQMKTPDGRCIFYTEEDGLGGCRVHNARPWRCGQWPLHPSILDDETNFNIIRNSCPGMNKELSYAEFTAILRELMRTGRIKC